MCHLIQRYYSKWWKVILTSFDGNISEGKLTSTVFRRECTEENAAFFFFFYDDVRLPLEHEGRVGTCMSPAHEVGSHTQSPWLSWKAHGSLSFVR